MEQKRDTVRNQSTEQLFSQDRPKEKMIDNAEESVQQARLSEEELFLQNIFLDKETTEDGMTVVESRSQEHSQPSPDLAPPLAAESSDQYSPSGQRNPAESDSSAMPGAGLESAPTDSSEAYRAHAVNFRQNAENPAFSSVAGESPRQGYQHEAAGGTDQLADQPGAPLLSEAPLVEQADNDDDGTDDKPEPAGERPEAGAGEQPENTPPPPPVAETENAVQDPGSIVDDPESSKADPVATTENSSQPPEVPTPPSARSEAATANSAPVVGAVDLGSIEEDAAITFDGEQLLAQASDVDGDSLQVTGVRVDEVHGSIEGNSGDDELAGGTGSDQIDGDQGSDRLALQDVRSEEHVTPNESSSSSNTDTVADRDGSDTIENIETVEFRDQTVAADDLLVAEIADPAPIADAGDGGLTDTEAAGAEGVQVNLDNVENRGNSSSQENNGNPGNQENRGNSGNQENRGNSGNQENNGNPRNQENRGNSGNQENRGNSGNQQNRGNSGNQGNEDETSAGGDDELLLAMEASAGVESEQGWAESVEIEADQSAQGSTWDLPSDVAQDEADLAASAMDLTPDTSGVVSMTESANGGVEGLEAIEG